MTRSRRLLHDGWTLRLDPQARAALGADAPDVAATVPGCVHTDLLAAGLLADPLQDDNEATQHWIGESDWVYRLNFDAEPAGDGERADLVCDGLDTVATVVLNGTELGRSENQHRTYRFDVGAVLRGDGNELEVRFESPLRFASERRDRLGDLPNPYGEPFNFIRKMACNFGWDWGPRVTTSGIWRPLALERWRGTRLAAVRPTPVVDSPSPVDGESGRVDVVVELEHAGASHHPAGGVQIEAVLTSPDGDVVGACSAPVGGGTVRLSVGAGTVRRWWPVGRGDQPLYRLDVVLTIDGTVADRSSQRLGFRHVQLDTTPDADGGTRFAFVVNGERIWIRGFNWIPDDCFPSGVTRERVRARIDQALAANANLLRVWGGGVYESDDFYEWCDERGVLVWQDFLFACAAYPEELLEDEVRAEAIDNIDRLMSHPSLLVWNGNNECLQGWHEWGWQDIVGDRPWGDHFYRELLPNLTSSLDPARPYLDGSPTSLDSRLAPNDPAHGTVHLWDVWNDSDYVHYRDHEPRFVAEFGFQAPPAWSTFQRALSNRTLSIADPGVLHHQRAFDGDAKLQRWLEHHFGEVTEYDDWLFDAQLNQAHAVEAGVGHFRGLHERCSGVVWWQLNDCWAAVSWSVVDVDGHLKPAWYAIRRAFADQLAMLQPGREGLDLVLVNDARDVWSDTVRFRRVTGEGAMQSTSDVAFSVEAGTAERLVVPADVIARGGRGGRHDDDDLVVATVAGRHLVHSGVLELERDDVPRWEVAASAGPGSITVDVTATTLVRDLCLFADRIDAHASVDEQLVTLLPGETHRFTVTTDVSDVTAVARWLDALRPADGPSRVLRAAGDRRSVLVQAGPYVDLSPATFTTRPARGVAGQRRGTAGWVL